VHLQLKITNILLFFYIFLYSSIIFIFKVICDRESFLRSRLEARHFILQEPRHLKGITNVGPVYEFEEQIKYSAIFLFYNFLKIAIYFCKMLFLVNTWIYMWLQIDCTWINTEKISFARTRNGNQNFSTNVIKFDSTFHYGWDNTTITTRI